MRNQDDDRKPLGWQNAGDKEDCETEIAGWTFGCEAGEKRTSEERNREES